MKGRPLTPRQREGIVATFKAGVAVSDIAAEFECSLATVNTILRDAGVKSQPDDKFFSMPDWRRRQILMMGP